MRIYIAARQKQKDKVKKISEELSKYTGLLIFDWTSIPNLKPYEENIEESKKISQEISKSIKEADLFILVSDEGGTDMFVELGIAITENLNKGTPKIYAIGKNNSRSLMLNHPSIIKINSIQELIKEEFNS